MNEPQAVILGITGASGAIYAVRLLDVLLAAGCQVHLSISSSGRAVLAQELDVQVDLKHFQPESLLRPRDEAGPGAALLRGVVSGQFSPAGQVHYHHYLDFMAPIASGSFLAGGMVVCPCSGSTLSAIAHAGANNLIQRAAEVQLKERRRLILVPRETPLSTVQLENMHRASLGGAVVLPAAPGWYHTVESVADLVNFVVGRICDQLQIDNQLVRRWGG